MSLFFFFLIFDRSNEFIVFFYFSLLS
uniref:Uncharacterized protein n=1 Tax=Rhizophora mucronata TaxID=61149 RepID=A0A2P2KGW9_RHIMU